jgi:hypothetical protein
MNAKATAQPVADVPQAPPPVSPPPPFAPDSNDVTDTVQDEGEDRPSPGSDPEAAVAQVKRPIPSRYIHVGMPVQFHTRELHRQLKRMGEGPYAAVITEIVDREKGIVGLRVTPPAAGFDCAHVEYAATNEGDEAHPDLERWWNMLGFYD